MKNLNTAMRVALLEIQKECLDLSDEASAVSTIERIKKQVALVVADPAWNVLSVPTSVRWNAPNADVVMDARACKDHPHVRATDYMEVHHLVNTSGCSPEEPWWCWPVMGVIKTAHGLQLVCPGDWIVEPIEGMYIVMSHHEYSALYL